MLKLVSCDLNDSSYNWNYPHPDRNRLTCWFDNHQDGREVINMKTLKIAVIMIVLGVVVLVIGLEACIYQSIYTVTVGGITVSQPMGIYPYQWLGIIISAIGAMLVGLGLIYALFKMKA